MKSLTDLNKKWWYRLLKVFFVGFFLLCIVSAFFIIKEDNGPHEVSDFKITCTADYSNGSSFFAQPQGLYLFQPFTGSIYSSLTESDKLKIRERCAISADDAVQSSTAAKAYVQQQEQLGASQESIQSYVDANYRPYNIVPASRTEGSYGKVAEYFLITLVVLLIIAEVLRRIFYYVTLGSLRPHKN